MSDSRETVSQRDFNGTIGGVDNRRADTATEQSLFQLIEGVMPWEEFHRRMFGKRVMGKMFGMDSDNTPLITIHSMPGNHVLYQTRAGLLMDNPFDSATLDWADRGGVTDFATMQNVDRLVRSLKVANIWGMFEGLYPIAGGTALAHAQNLISSDYPFTWVNGPTHSALGVTGNGISSYGYITGSETALPSLGHLACYIQDPASTIADYRDCMGLGNEFGSARYYLIQTVDLAYCAYWGFPGNLITCLDVPVWDGLLSNHRRSTIEHVAYRNDVQTGFTAVAFEANPMPTTLPIGLLCRIDNGGVPMELSDATIAFASFGQAMSGPQTVAFYSAVQAFQTAMGRQV